MPTRTSAAAPRLILVYGGSLPAPVLLSDWMSNHVLAIAIALGILGVGAGFAGWSRG